MERRKLLTPLEQYIGTVTESSEHATKRAHFYNNLRHFYRKKWGCPVKIPSIHGVEVDFFKLYEAVLDLGGWQKVANHEKWPQILRDVGMDEDIQVAEHGLRSIYMRYLSKFEQAETGNDHDEHDSDLMGSRSRMRGHLSSMANSESPISMPRAGEKAQTDSSAPDYHKVVKSLMSGLPNEVDFAVNVCSLLSHPGPYLLRLAECPQLMTALVAHCGIFTDGPNTLQELHLNAWQKQSEHNFSAFWRRSGIRDEDMLALMTNSSCSTSNDIEELDNEEEERLLELDDFEDDRLDLKNSVNWRVFQILSIFRNLSFEEVNSVPMAGNLALLKFLLVCCSSKWQQLVNGAFDTLSNIAGHIDLTSECSVFSQHLLLKTVSNGLFSDDKFQILRSIEIFTGLCNSKANESVICEFAEERILTRMFTLVTAKDILLCIVTLESIYQMSELGRPSCEVLSFHSRSIDILVDLATTDAASFGSSGLAGIKVVEIGHAGQLQPYHPQRSSNHLPPAPLRPLSPTPNASRSNLYSPPSSPGIIGGAGGLRHHYAPPPPSPLASVSNNINRIPMGVGCGMTTPSTVIAPGGGGMAGPQKVIVKKVVGLVGPGGNKIQTVAKTTVSSGKSTISSTGVTSPPPVAVQEVVAALNSHTTPLTIIASSTPSTSQQESKLERMTKSWIHDHCVVETGAVSNRGEMYAHLVEYMQSHDMLSGSLQMFINQLKACYPSITMIHSPGSSVYSVEGLRFTKNGVDVNHQAKSSSSSSSLSSDLASQHPLMQQMLSSPIPPSVNGHSGIPEVTATANDSSEHSKSKSHSPGQKSENNNNNNNNQSQDATKKSDSKNPKTPLLNGHLNHHKSWEKVEENDVNGELCNGGDVVEKNHHKVEGKDATTTATAKMNGVEPKSVEDRAGSAEPKEECLKEEEKEKETTEKEHMSNGVGETPTGAAAKGKKRPIVNGTPKTSTNKKAKLANRALTTSSLNTHPDGSSSLQAPATPVRANSTSRMDSSQPSTSTGDFMCEWDCCGRFFPSGSSMLYHNTHDHLNKLVAGTNDEDEDEEDDEREQEEKDSDHTPIVCRWPSCDGTPRSKWSMVTHLQDHHCTDQQLQAALRKRREMGIHSYTSMIRQQLEKVKEISHHPGYSKFAAIEAIRRHAFSFMPKDITDDSEGPVTRSMRLTSCLILRNIARHSVEGRRKIRKHESHLSWMALSRMEGSAALAQCLGELVQHSSLPDTSSSTTLAAKANENGGGSGSGSNSEVEAT